MSRDDHAVELIEPWRPIDDRVLLQRSQRCHKGEFRHVNISTRQYDVDRILVGLSWELHCRNQLDRALERWHTTGRQKGSQLHDQSEFLHNYCTLVSLHDSDNAGAVRIFVALSCELWGYLYIYIIWIRLDYITRHNFPPNRSVSSGNRTPGSRFYSTFWISQFVSTSSYFRVL